MNNIRIETNVAGSFVIDAKGIRSTEPVPIDSDSWDARSHTLKMKGASCGVTMNVFGGNCVIGNMSVGNVFIDGRMVTPGAQYTAPTKMYSRSWDELNLQAPSLGELCVKGSGDYDVSMPLARDCDLTITGSGSIRIRGNHDSYLTATITGSGDIKGKGIISEITATVTGSGDIKGFVVSKKVKGTVTGSGAIKMTRYPEAVMQKIVTGSGKVSIKMIEDDVKHAFDKY